MSQTRKLEAALWIVAALSTGLLVAGCGSKQSAESSPSVTVQAATAEDEAIQQVVTSDATIFPRDQAAIVPKITAPVKKFYVERGSHVRAGQLLAELENQDLADAVTENRGALEEAQTNYQTAEQKAQQDLRLARQQVDAQRQIYNSRVKLLKEGAIAEKDVEDSRVSLTQAQNQYDLAQKAYDRKVAEAQLTAARGKAAGAQTQLNYAKITSPIDGVVTDRPLYAGETATNGSPLLTVMDISRIIAKAHIAQQEAALLKAGDDATVSAAGMENPVQGKVTLVSPALDPNSTTVEIWVTAVNTGEKLKPGGAAKVTIVAKIVRHAIVIPATALLTDTDGMTAVILLGPNNRPVKQSVKAGIRNGDDVQITEGLRAGQRVVTTGAFELNSEDPDVLAKTTIEVQTPKADGDDKD